MSRALVRLFTEKLDRLSISDYHGLVSPGLTCYLNSVLQVLFMTKGFRDSINRRRSDDQTKMDALLQDLFSALERGSAQTRAVTETLGISDVYEQRDAAEYFEKIMCLTSAEASQMFKGELTHTTTCAHCSSSSSSSGFFWILPLSMENSSSRTYSVTQGLEAFFSRETVQGENQLYCDGCCAKRDTHIECEMSGRPEVLTLLLKRFTYNNVLRRYEKLLGRVKVPPTLNVQDCEYELYALVHHFGSLSGGHYTAHIRSFQNGDWYCFNDSAVDRVKEPLFGPERSSLRSQSAYLLMYKKVRSYSEKDSSAGSHVVAEGRCEENCVPVRTPSPPLLNGQASSLEFENRRVRSQGRSQVRSQVRSHVRSNADADTHFTTNPKLSSMDKDGGSSRPVPPTHWEDFPVDFLHVSFENSRNKTESEMAGRTKSGFDSDGYQNKSATLTEVSKEGDERKRGREARVGSSGGSSSSASARSRSNGRSDASPCARRRSSSITKNRADAGSERRKKKSESSKETMQRRAWR